MKQHTGRSALDLAESAVLAAAIFVAALPALRAFQVAGAVVLLVVSAGVPVLISFLVARALRWPAAASFSVSLVGLTVVLLCSGGLRAGVTYHDLVSGPNRVLTETLPLYGGPAALAPLLLLVWVVAATVGELVARAPISAPPRISLFVPVPLFVVSYGVAVGAPHRNDVAGPVLLLLLAVAAVIRNATFGRSIHFGNDDGDRRVRPPRSFAVGMAAAGLTTALLWAVVPQVPGLADHPIAFHRFPPTARPVVADPLGAMAQLRDGTSSTHASTVLIVRLSAPSSGYLGLAVLDDYDGGLWRFGAAFQPTGGRIPGPPGLPTESEVVQQVTELSSLPVPLLPAIDRPVSVSGISVATDPVTGMLVPQSSGGGPVSYTVVSEAPASTLGELPPVDQMGASSVQEDTTLPPDTATDIATVVRFLAVLTGVRPSPSVSFLDAAVTALQANTRRIDPQLAPPGQSSPSHLGGTSLSEVINAVTVNRAATPEQFATFLAMVARYLGIPARVVTGFRIPPPAPGRLVSPGRYQVTTEQAWAWIEVPVSGLGWVVVDPTPARVTGVASPPPESVQAPATTLPPRQANVVPRASILGGHALAPAAHIRVPHFRRVPTWEVVAIAVGGAMVAALIGGPGQAWARRWWRRRSRRSAEPSELAVGAWLELLDGLSQAGLRPEPGSTSREVASEAAGCFGPDLMEPIGAIGGVAERALFSLASPPDAESARQSWETQRTIGRRIRKGLAPGERVRWSVLVGSTPRRPAGR